VLVLTQVIESKQKWVASLTKLLEIPEMDAEQRTKILDKVIDLTWMRSNKMKRIYSRCPRIKG
jgi:hypothetical protein